MQSMMCDRCGYSLVRNDDLFLSWMVNPDMGRRYDHPHCDDSDQRNWGHVPVTMKEYAKTHLVDIAAWL